jgi:hypothetical protein
MKCGERRREGESEREKLIKRVRDRAKERIVNGVS